MSDLQQTFNKTTDEFSLKQVLVYKYLELMTSFVETDVAISQK